MSSIIGGLSPSYSTYRIIFCIIILLYIKSVQNTLNLIWPNNTFVQLSNGTCLALLGLIPVSHMVVFLLGAAGAISNLSNLYVFTAIFEIIIFLSVSYEYALVQYVSYIGAPQRKYQYALVIILPSISAIAFVFVIFFPIVLFANPEIVLLMVNLVGVLTILWLALLIIYYWKVIIVFIKNNYRLLARVAIFALPILLLTVIMIPVMSNPNAMLIVGLILLFMLLLLVFLYISAILFQYRKWRRRLQNKSPFTVNELFEETKHSFKRISLYKLRYVRTHNILEIDVNTLSSLATWIVSLENSRHVKSSDSENDLSDQMLDELTQMLRHVKERLKTLEL